MAIADKTRKILWARSGNRCALCRHKLLVDETESDEESIVGEECHICSQSSNGPRYDSTLGADKINHLDNLILLCSIHHKVIDDQVETYTKEIICGLKANHEKWVEEKLKCKEEIPPVLLRRFKQNMPGRLTLMTSGKVLMALASNCSAAYHDYSEDLSDAEVDLVGGFLQNMRDYVDLWADIEPIKQVRAINEINDSIKELAGHGFLLFAATESQRLEGGIGSPSNWLVLHLTIARASDPGVQFQETEVNKTSNQEAPPHEDKTRPKHTDSQRDCRKSQKA